VKRWISKCNRSRDLYLTKLFYLLSPTSCGGLSVLHFESPTELGAAPKPMRTRLLKQVLQFPLSTHISVWSSKTSYLDTLWPAFPITLTSHSISSLRGLSSLMEDENDENGERLNKVPHFVHVASFSDYFFSPSRSGPMIPCQSTVK
jgi:hypothetical protein